LSSGNFQSENSMALLHSQGQQRGVPTLSASPLRVSAAPIKDMTSQEKERLKKRVKLFYENHHQKGLENFEKNVEIVLLTASYSEEYLFTRMYEKYSVDGTLENQQATQAGVMGSKNRSRPATPTRDKNNNNNSGSTATSPSPTRGSLIAANEKEQNQQQNQQSQNTREVSVSGEVDSWLSPEQKRLTSKQQQQRENDSNKTFTGISDHIIYSEVFPNTDLKKFERNGFQCRGVIFDATNNNNNKNKDKNQHQQKTVSVFFTLRNATALLEAKTASSSSSSSSSTGAASSSVADVLTKEEKEDNLRISILVSSFNANDTNEMCSVAVDVPLSFFCRTFIPHLKTSSSSGEIEFKMLDNNNNLAEWNVVKEISAWKVKTRASFA
jgi:hypothetical protein